MQQPRSPRRLRLLTRQAKKRRNVMRALHRRLSKMLQQRRKITLRLLLELSPQLSTRQPRSRHQSLEKGLKLLIRLPRAQSVMPYQLWSVLPCFMLCCFLHSASHATVDDLPRNPSWHRINRMLQACYPAKSGVHRQLNI
jgi:hypothetical protein